jgi:hypothetical protein
LPLTDDAWLKRRRAAETPEFIPDPRLMAAMPGTYIDPSLRRPLATHASDYRENSMLLYVRKSFMIFKLVLACIAFLAAMIALLGTAQNSFLLTQDTGKQLGVIMALVFGIITIVEAFMAPPEAIVGEKFLTGWKSQSAAPSTVVGFQKAEEEPAGAVG